MSHQAHWDNIYTTKDAQSVSWYRPHLDQSLALLSGLGIGLDARILDVGGGASTLVDDLLAQGFRHVTVLDIAPSALATAQARLGDAARRVAWLQADATQVTLPPASVDVWHDRAVFHFLTDAMDRARYVERLRLALCVGGYAIIATFAPDGPTMCSGLPVVRYAPGELLAVLGAGMRLVDSRRETHVTPSGGEQRFQYSVFRRES